MGGTLKVTKLGRNGFRIENGSIGLVSSTEGVQAYIIGISECPVSRIKTEITGLLSDAIREGLIGVARIRLSRFWRSYGY